LGGTENKNNWECWGRFDDNLTYRVIRFLRKQPGSQDGHLSIYIHAKVKYILHPLFYPTAKTEISEKTNEKLKKSLLFVFQRLNLGKI